MAALNSHSTHAPHARRTMNILQAYDMPIYIGNSTYGLGLTWDKG